jgi:hypothetical protein
MLIDRFKNFIVGNENHSLKIIFRVQEASQSVRRQRKINQAPITYFINRAVTGVVGRDSSS